MMNKRNENLNVVEMKNIYKYFGEFCANEDVNFDLRQGEIHALLGENGAGKSTLMNILYGLYSHDKGMIKVMGEEVEINNPSDAISQGIGMVHQHFMLVPHMTVTENIFLGMKSAGFKLDRDALNKRVHDLSCRYDFKVNPTSYIWQLPVGLQQKVEILKLLMRDTHILILGATAASKKPYKQAI